MGRPKGPEGRNPGVLFAALFLWGLGGGALAGEGVDRPPSPTPPYELSSASATLRLTVGKSLLLSVPYPIRRISVAEPGVADVVTVSRQQFLLSGKAPGVTNLIIWDEGDRSFIHNLLVQADAEALAQGLKELYPKETLSVQAIRDNLVLSGVTDRPEVRETVGRIAESFAPKKVVNLISAPGLAPLISPGMRAVTVRVDEVIGVAGFLSPGSRVDVLTTMEVDQQRGPAGTVSKVILQNVKVLAIGERMETKDSEAKKVPLVTLLVNPGQAERLTLASTKGKILLALRNDRDETAAETPGVTPPQLVFGAAPAAPRPREAPVRVAPKPPPPRAVGIEVIRGGKRTLESVGE